MDKVEKEKPAAGKEASAEDKKRKSKWDNPAGGAPAPHGLPIRQHTAALAGTGSGGKKLKS